MQNIRQKVWYNAFEKIKDEYRYIHYSSDNRLILYLWPGEKIYQNSTYYQLKYILSMIGFRGLIPKSSLNADSFDSVTKRADELKKNCLLILDFFAEVARVNDIKAITNLKILAENGNYQYIGTFNKSMFTTLQKIIQNQKQLAQSSKLTHSESVTHLSDAFGPVSLEFIILQQAIKSYQECQQKIYQQSKKYYKAHKSLLTSVDLYKASFTDVNLIYNMDEKNRRYEQCQSLLIAAEKWYQNIGGMCGELFQKKRSIVDAYQKILINLERCLRDVSRHSINKTKQLLVHMSASIGQTVQAMKKFQQSNTKPQLSSIFKQSTDIKKLENFNNPEQIDKNCFLPLAIEYAHLLKQQNISLFNIEIVNYLKIVEQRLKSRKAQNKKLYEAIKMYFANMQKIQSAVVKELLVGFEKSRKKLAEVFGNRFVTFLKVITSLFQISVGINEKMMNSTLALRQSIQTCINEDSKLIKYFSEQTKSNIQRFTTKKQSKKEDQKSQDPEYQAASMRLLKKEISQKADFIKHMISGFQEKIETNHIKLMSYCTQLVGVTRSSMQELYSLCQEYIQLYFGSQSLSLNLQKFQDDFEATRKKGQEAYQQLQMHTLMKDQSQIVFQGEFSKIAMFKRLKKPTKIQNLDQSFEILQLIEKRDSVEPKVSGQIERTKSDKGPQNLTEIEKERKNADFLSNKINFKQNQLLIKTFSCALAQKIILQGKLFLTTDRICFHSNFNSGNLFFGKTFIQFPKADIKKIQKRRLTLLFDNSISFTTVNGEIIFTSIFSRDQAYNLICKTFNFNLDNQVYQYEEKESEELPEFLIELEENDDIKLCDLEARKESIEKEIVGFPFVDSVVVDFNEEGLNALKLFKIFYHNFEIAINGRKYDNFLNYYKQTLNHTEVSIEQWNPSLSLIINQSNIKQTSPTSSKRKIHSTVPVTASGVPFMPKTAKSAQTQTLYFFSKHKFILQSTIETTGVPYCDTFKVELRTTVDSNQDGKCKLTMQYFINFVKNTMMRGVIETKTKQETVGAAKIWVNAMKKHFEQLAQKSKSSSNKPKNAEQQLKSSLSQSNQRIQSLEQQNRVLKNKICEMEKMSKNLKISTIVFAVLSVIILLYFVL